MINICWVILRSNLVLKRFTKHDVDVFPHQNDFVLSSLPCQCDDITANSGYLPTTKMSYYISGETVKLDYLAMTSYLRMALNSS